MKHIMISIRPEWVEKILNREKLSEIRKSCPKEECIVEIYCTKGQELWGDGTGDTWYGIAEDEDLERVFELNPTLARLNGKVVARWHQRCVTPHPYADLSYPTPSYDGDPSMCDCGMGYWVTVNDCREMCLRYEDLLAYGKGKKIYAWHIDNLEIYETPKELREFGLTRAPQSWQYLEDINESI